MAGCLSSPLFHLYCVLQLLGRIIRVDHVSDYKKPKETGEEDELTKQLRAEGCAPKVPQAQVMEDLPTLRPSDSAGSVSLFLLLGSPAGSLGITVLVRFLCM